MSNYPCSHIQTTKKPAMRLNMRVSILLSIVVDVSLADREGFEPSIRYERIHAFQACAFNHSATCPFCMARPFRHSIRKAGYYNPNISHLLDVERVSVAKPSFAQHNGQSYRLQG